MGKNSRNILLLTATIRPNTNQPGLVLSNVEERLAQYIKALEYYIHAKSSGYIDAIVFVDNSGYDVSEISQKYGRNDIEIISFYGLDYPSDYHRGYGEMTLVVKAYEYSKTLRQVKDFDRVWKVTGRYKVLNINKIMKYSAIQYDLLCKINQEWMSMEVFSWQSRGFYILIKELPNLLQGKSPPEIIIPKAIKDFPNLKISSDLYPALIDGYRGGDGKPFIGRLGYFRHFFALIRFWSKYFYIRLR